MIELTHQENAIVKTNPFAQILSSQASGTDFSELVYCPLLLTGNHSLLGHLSSANAIIKRIKKSPIVKVIFSGPHGYISPRWHKEQTVPTWNYATVSIICRVNIIEDSSNKLTAMKQISHCFDPQWNFSDFNQTDNIKMVQQMLSAITVFTLDMIEIKSKFKLSQNRSLACRTAFKENLALTGYPDLAKIQLW